MKETLKLLNTHGGEFDIASIYVCVYLDEFLSLFLFLFVCVCLSKQFQVFIML